MGMLGMFSGRRLLLIQGHLVNEATRRNGMATMNDASPYAGLSLNERVHIALELAENISMEHDGFHHLVSELVGQLRLGNDQAKQGREALTLAEALLERLRDMRRHCELMDCLDSMRASTAH